MYLHKYDDCDAALHNHHTVTILLIPVMLGSVSGDLHSIVGPLITPITLKYFMGHVIVSSEVSFLDLVDVTIERQENQDAWESFNQDLQHFHIVWTLKLLKLVCWLKYFTQRGHPEKKKNH